MNKKVFTVIGIILIIAIGLLLLSKKVKSPDTKTNSLKNISVKIGGETFDLVNGTAEKESAPGSATKNKVSIFGEPVVGDLDKDGDSDAAVLLVNNPGGSGTFYYAVLAINNSGTYKATETMFLGDRIAPQTVEIQEGRAVYNYAERKAGEAMSVQPSVGKSLWVHYDAKNNQIGEWVKDFEGEANPAVMNLQMKKWIWVKTELNDETVIAPKRTDAFSLTFGKDGKVSITTDCNSMGATYTANKASLLFTNMYSTLMYCDGSQEQEFSKTLGDINSYIFTSKGELVLMIKYDSGTMTFR